VKVYAAENKKYQETFFIIYTLTRGISGIDKN
jgi:hypothetical protein